MTRAGEMRLAFDRGFAEQPRTDTALRESFLAIRLGTTAYALRLSEVSGMFFNKKVTRIPTSHAALFGLASFRGAVMPVYDLHALLGFPASSTVRWLVTTSAAAVALAFDSFEGHLQISREAVVPPGTGEGSRDHVHEFVRTAGDIRAVVDLASVVTFIRAQMPQTIS